MTNEIIFGAIERIQEQLTVMQGSIKALQGDITNIKGNISSIKEDVKLLKFDIEILKENDEEFRENINMLVKWGERAQHVVDIKLIDDIYDEVTE